MAILKKNFDKKGAFLLNIIFSIMMTGIVIGATASIFDIDLKTVSARYSALKNNNTYENLNTIKKAIKGGHLTRYEKVVSGVIANGSELKIQTSYFSSNASKVDILDIKCPANNKPLYYQINTNSPIKVIDNVTNCSFQYLDGNGAITNELAKISAVKLNFEYQLPNQEKEKVVIYQKMMQNS